MADRLSSADTPIADMEPAAAGPSNMDLWNMVVAKDWQLQTMTERLNAKTDQLECLIAHSGRTDWALHKATDMVLALQGNMRGAVEYVARGLTGCRAEDGITTRLMTLQFDAAFTEKLKAHAKRFNVELPRAFDCMRTIYDRLCQDSQGRRPCSSELRSRDMHGSEETVYLRYADITAPAQRAVLHAIFDYGAIKYTVIDERGNLVLSP